MTHIFKRLCPNIAHKLMRKTFITERKEFQKMHIFVNKTYPCIEYLFIFFISPKIWIDLFPLEQAKYSFFFFAPTLLQEKFYSIYKMESKLCTIFI